MKLRLYTSFACDSCDWAIERFGDHLLRCPNPDCIHYGKAYHEPTMVLSHLEEAETFAPHKRNME